MPEDATSQDTPHNAVAVNGRAYEIIDHAYDVIVVGAGGSGLRAVVGASEADESAKETARKAAEDALGDVLGVVNTFFLSGANFIGGVSPSIADMRFAATVEFIRITDFAVPVWLDNYMERIEATLGDAYAEPAADVRGYIDYVRTQSG